MTDNSKPNKVRDFQFDTDDFEARTESGRAHYSKKSLEKLVLLEISKLTAALNNLGKLLPEIKMTNTQFHKLLRTVGTQTDSLETHEISTATDFIVEIERASIPVGEERNNQHLDVTPSLKPKRKSTLAKDPKPKQRNREILVKGIPSVVPIEEIQVELAAINIPAVNKSRLKSWKRPNKELRHVALTTSATIPELQKIKTIVGFRIRIENLVKPIGRNDRYRYGESTQRKLYERLKTLLKDSQRFAKRITMKGTFATIFLALVAVVLCWEFPGHPGTDCPTTLKIMSEDPEHRWMLPKCEEDGTFFPMQCFPGTTACMCVAADGSPLTLPGFVNVTACDCFTEYYKMWLKDEDSPVLPRCADDGTFKPLQCNKAEGVCWCVDKTGHVLTKPSKDTTSC